MTTEDIQIMINKICRSCMCESAHMHNMFEKKAELADDTVLLSDMLMACTSVEVMAGDGLPFLLCVSCEYKLSSAFKFKQQCEKSDTSLRELINQQDNKSKTEETIVIQPDVHEGLFVEDEDDLPLAKRFKNDCLADLTCSYCLKIFTTKKGLRVHMRQHTGDGMRYCPICPARYTRTNHLMRHLKSHDKQNKNHSCKICMEKCALASDLFTHMKIHIEQVEKRNKKENEKDKIVMHIKKEDDCNFLTVKNEKEKEWQSVEIQEVIGEQDVENKDDKIQLEEGVLKDDDSMDIPLSQFPFSDDDNNDNDNDVLESKENNKDEDFVVVETTKKKKRGRPPGKKDATLYECKECRKILSSYWGLKIHMRKHTGTDLTNFKIRECEFCDRKFKYKKSFVHHMQLEHGMSDIESEIEKNEATAKQDEVKNKETNNENCQTNGTIIDEAMDKLDGSDEFDVPGENQVVVKRKLKIHICHVCEAQFARANHLTRHMTLHRAVLQHKCDRCDQAFFTETLLKQHIEQQHINKPYVCTTCNKPFSRGEHLIRHLKLHQALTDEGQHKCSICENLFARSDLLANHIKTHLMQDKRHVCIECGKAFNRLDNLKTHQRIHTGLKDNSKLHLCVYCGKEFNNSSNMIVHMRRHTGERPYKCTVCGKGFPRSHDLKCHERTHSGEKPYLCTLCGKSFNKSNKLLRHSRVHTGERPYVCNICSRAFTQSNDLALHMRRHTGARPYACGVCSARFIQSGQLKNHRKATGHWMETQPDLKGGHRVEPVTSVVEPMPIRFKTFGKNRPVKIEDELIQQQQSQSIPQPQQQQIIESQPQLATLQTQPQRILMGIMGNIKIQNDVQPLIIDGNKLVELPGGQLGLLPVIHGVNGEEIKLKTKISSFNITQVEEDLDKNEVVSTSSTFHEGDSVAFSTVQTSTTYTSEENFTF